MAEYIEREALKEELLKKGFYPAIVAGTLEQLPAANVAEVVRCGECRHWAADVGGKEMFCDHPHSILTATTKDDFCSHGERKAMPDES